MQIADGGATREGAAGGTSVGDYRVHFVVEPYLLPEPCGTRHGRQCGEQDAFLYLSIYLPAAGARNQPVLLCPAGRYRVLYSKKHSSLFHDAARHGVQAA